MSKYLNTALVILFWLISTTCLAGGSGPSVSLTSPLSGATFVSPANIVITASASEKGGTIARVDFYQGTTLIGSSTTSPYTVTWANVIGGSYSLTAKATDAAGVLKASTAVGIVVTGSKIHISTPAAGSTLYGGATVVAGTFTGDATSTVLVDNGTSSRLATISNNNAFSANLPVFIGSNTLKVTVVHTDKTSDTASVTVTGNDSPKIAFLAPFSATFNAPGDVLFGVSAVSPASTISKVDFYTNGVLAGTVLSPPYQYTLTNALAQSYAIQATATDIVGSVSSAFTTVTGIGPNTPPNISLTSPLNGAVYPALANIPLAVNASDPDGSVVVVRYYQNGSLLSTTNIPPFSFNWLNVSASAYTLTAVATDNRSGTATSTPISINVDVPPTVSLTAPATGASYYAPATIGFSASAADSDGTVAKVDFYQGAIRVGTATAAPYTFNWVNVPAGNYALSAIATDNLGVTTTSAAATVTVIPNSPPTVSLTSPTASFSAYAPATVALSANAADSDGTVAKVDFYQGTTLIGTATSAPYTYTWTGVAAGTYTITAVATDNLGATTTSSPVTITVNALQVALATPTNNATLTGNNVQVSGTFQGPANSGILVNGVIASTDANNFYATVPLTPGSNAITATITTLAGTTATQTVNVTSDGIAPALQISADHLEGIAPLTVNFTLRNTGTVDLTVQFSGDTPFVVPAGNSGTGSATFTVAGAYPFTVTSTDANNNTTTQNLTVVVNDPIRMDAKFQAIWDGMNNAVVAGDKATALGYLSVSAQAKYGEVFDALQANYQQIVASFSQPMRMDVSSNLGEYAIRRTINGVNTIFFVYYLRDVTGVWKLDSM